MKNLKNNVNQSGESGTEKQKMEDSLALIEKANTCSVLMTQLCKEMGLVPTKTTHQEFVNRFSELQKKSLELQKELQEMYISSTNVKPTKKRKSKDLGINRITGEIQEKPDWVEDFEKSKEEVGF